MSERRLDSYYFGFNTSGNDDVDAVLEAVRDAGKWSHSTEMWSDPKDGKDGPTCADNIQTAANQCAGVIAALKAENERLVADNADLRESLHYANGVADVNIADNERLHTELAELRAKAERLHEALRVRSRIWTEPLRGTPQTRCYECEAQWYADGKERHAPDCPAHPGFLGAKGAV